MYARITERGRTILRGASQEAHRLHHNFVRSEHLLLALLRDETNSAVAVLRECGIDSARVLAILEERTAPWVEEFTLLGDRYPLTPSVRNVLHWAFEEARSFGHDHVCTEHFLLGLLREVECVAARILAEFGLTLDRAREAVTGSGFPLSAPIIVVDAV